MGKSGASNNIISAPENPRNTAVRISDVILEIIRENVGVWLRGNGSSESRMFIELENG
jgi:hypothetical protein